MNRIIDELRKAFADRVTIPQAREYVESLGYATLPKGRVRYIDGVRTVEVELADFPGHYFSVWRLPDGSLYGEC